MSSIPSAAWSTVPISQLYEGLYDGPHATPQPADDGPVFLGIKNVTEDGHLDLTDIRHIAEEEFATWTRRIEPRPGDIVFTYEATLNRYAIIPQGFRGCLGRRMALIRPNPKRVDTRYLHFYFFTPAWRDVIRQFTLAGATVDRLPLTRFPEFPVQVPPIDEQRRIANILSAYDDLIQNCAKRIRVLDEMVRALYREWFVDFRYPGHEKVPIVQSPVGRIPKSWTVAEVGDLSEKPDGVQTGPFGSQLHQHEYSSEGVPVVMPKDLRAFRIDETDIARIPEETAQRLAKHRMEVGDIVYGRRGDIGRRAFVMEHQLGAFCGTGCLRIRPNPVAVDGWYLFQHLGRDEVVALIAGRAQGVTMPNLNTRLLATVPIIVAPRPLQDIFRDRSYPLAVFREKVIGEVNNLRKTRDLLLPRLLSGQLSVDVESAA